MTPHQIMLVKESFSLIVPMANDVTDIFYTRLFKLDPSLRPMFTSDMRDQGVKLMATLKMVVNGLDRPNELLFAVRQLGLRHAAYGVQNAHYETVGKALLGTLHQGLGEAFTPDVEEAWSLAYTLLADTMIAAASEVKYSSAYMAA